MLKTPIAFAGMLLLASTAAFAEEAFTVKVNDIPPVVWHCGQPSGLFPHVDHFFRIGPMTAWARRPTDSRGDTRDD
jgi:hypothetical protein